MTDGDRWKRRSGGDDLSNWVPIFNHSFRWSKSSHIFVSGLAEPIFPSKIGAYFFNRTNKPIYQTQVDSLKAKMPFSSIPRFRKRLLHSSVNCPLSLPSDYPKNLPLIIIHPHSFTTANREVLINILWLFGLFLCYGQRPLFPKTSYSLSLHQGYLKHYSLQT